MLASGRALRPPLRVAGRIVVDHLGHLSLVPVADRKPRGVSWEDWIGRQIHEAMARGEFDDLPGAGKPIPGLDKPHDELWWVKQKLRREEASFLPPTLAIRKDVEDTLAAVEAMGSEADVRKTLQQLNARIRTVNRTATSGPPSTTMPLNVEAVVARWRSRR
jgi:hypothetical protein